MSRDAVISVCSIQNNDEKERIEIVSPGSFFKENDEFVATYQETELSGLGDTLTTLRIGKNYFNMIRTGDINTTMEFKNGKRAYGNRIIRDLFLMFLDPLIGRMNPFNVRARQC